MRALTAVRTSSEWLMKPYRSRLALRLVGRACEAVRYAFVRPRIQHLFWIVSSSRNVGEAAIRCLDSVYQQRYESGLVTHYFIDDGSEDETPLQIAEWLHRHPDHRTRFVRREERWGGHSEQPRGFSRSTGRLCCDRAQR